MKQVMGGFMEFLKDYNIVGLAVWVIMWVHSGNLVKSLVDDVLMPAVLQPALKAAWAADIAQLATAGGVKYGLFLASLINFIAIAFVVYLIVTYFVNKFMPEKK